jgi:ABC-type dipeptide/oligopeptide/nickel transport system ATPase component
MAILVISHDIGVVRALCDRVLVMYHGEILEEVAAAELTVDGVGHPYTKALLEATPELDVPVKEPVHD